VTLLQSLQDRSAVLGVGAAEAEDHGHRSLCGGAEAGDGRRRVACQGDPADHVDGEGVRVGAHGSDHLEGGGDLLLAEVPLEVDHAGDTQRGGELIDGVGRHAGAVGDDEDAAAATGSPRLGPGIEERDAEVVALAAEHQGGSAPLALAT